MTTPEVIPTSIYSRDYTALHVAQSRPALTKVQHVAARGIGENTNNTNNSVDNNYTWQGNVRETTLTVHRKPTTQFPQSRCEWCTCIQVLMSTEQHLYNKQHQVNSFGVYLLFSRFFFCLLFFSARRLNIDVFTPSARHATTSLHLGT